MAIWFVKSSVAELNKKYDTNMINHLGIQITNITESSLTGTIPVDFRNRQPFGFLHGGASMVLAETLGSIASNLCLDPSRYHAVGHAIFGNHIKAVQAGMVTGVATPLHLGRNSHVWRIDMVDENREAVCCSQLTTSIVAPV
jgi:1,4-dihydroxy-2-naphthoyl-CoA hydrolase